MADPQSPNRDAPEPPTAPRKPYERPQLAKKRSLAQATLFTAMGPTTTLTASG